MYDDSIERLANWIGENSTFSDWMAGCWAILLLGMASGLYL